MQRVLTGIVAILVLTGVVSSASFYLHEPYNPGFVEHPLVVNLHVVLGALYLTFGALQFLPRIRNRWPAYHRNAGRILVAVAFVVGVEALFLALFVPFSGWPGRVGNGFFAAFFLAATARAVFHIRRRDIARHREWMIRAFAIALGIATMRLLFLPALVIARAESPTDDIVRWLSVASFMTAFCAHAAAAEFWIRRTRERREPVSSAASQAPLEGQRAQNKPI